MSLAALIKKGGLRQIATATPATSATDTAQKGPTVATVAGVAVAPAPDKAANAPVHNIGLAAAGTVDRQCWPHTQAMNTTEIDAFTARVHLFTRRGIGGTESEGLADGLVIRDRDGDDRRLCLECQHLRGGGRSWACNQWRAAGHGAAGIPADMVMLLQRCDGFKGEAASMQHDHKPPERAKGTPEG